MRPARMPLVLAGRMLKRWRYVAVYGPEVMACVCSAHVGPARQVWWAVWDREGRRLHERTRMLVGRGRVEVERPGRVHVRDGDVAIEWELDEGPPEETLTPAGRAWIWTAKQAGVPVRGRIRAGEREWEVDGPGFVDDSAGYHDRRTSWLWCAGLGAAADGRPVAWNLVHGIHDPPHGSERRVWVDGAPREVGPADFEPDLSAVRCDGAQLRFAAEVTRARHDRLLVFRSRYRQPFGTFSGTLPGGIELAEGYGVMESHDVVW